MAARKNTRKSGPKSTTIAAYMGVFLLVVSMVAIGYQPPEKSSQPVANAVASPTTAQSNGSQPSVDQMVATSVAANIAERANLPVATNLANLSLSLTAESELAQTDANVISKPQIVQPNADGRTIREYKAVAGDSVPTVAEKHGISATTIRWANNLASDALTPGQTVKIPSSDGVLYTLRDGDTVDSLASRYGANKEVLIAYNDLEQSSSLPAGRQILIPGGQLPTNERPGYVTPSIRSNSIYSGGYGVNSTIASASAGNRYAFGNCTWYVYERRAQLGRPIGSFWGNASTWAAYARAAGFTVNGSPAVGAIMQTGGGYAGYGHVMVVESVNPGVSVSISEMNGYRFGGGFNRIGHGDIPWSEAVSGQYNYIH